jgi:ribonuclease E
MSTNKMLIDAAHPEETRVVVLSGNRLHDFDVESVARKQFKGNIYLAKVIRVEPSLQAAFVDYGGNRHGFLSFSEIHPDYYQIPIEDRQALLAEHEAAELAEEATEEAEVTEATNESEETTDEDAVAADAESSDENTEKTVDEEATEGADDGDDGENEVGTKKTRKGVETLGGDDTEEARTKRRAPSHRRYKIQEVVKRRQILLIQVVKEERGNKGAALTTYISLAGRYCVLMPNTARGGGISRKITNGGDRKQLKAILSDLKIPEGMAVIVRTAGIKRSKAEIKRDYEYLVRLWDSVRKRTLESSAPSLVHEEGNLIKRSIRDLYARDIEEIIVAGDRGYRMAKDFIKLLVPSHAKRVQPYTESTETIFQHYQVEDQLDAIHSPEVQMKSGAYIVINPTEALVSIDVNSGRSTRERNIEETAFKTNLEAADEIACQLRLRDLAGLIVIDFIDMEVNRNNSQVEKRMKEAMRHDRARIQIGRISPFGLLEMSRQRLRMSLIETSSEPCPYCEGTGIRRSTDSAALVVLRAIQEEANRKIATSLITHVPTAVALYILNEKRPALADIEQSTGVSIIVTADESLIPPAVRIERVKAGGQIELVTQSPSNNTAPAEEKTSKRKRRPRHRKSSNVEAEATDSQSSESNSQSQSQNQETNEAVSTDDESGENKGPKRRRRGKRGGRRRRGRPEESNASEETVAQSVNEGETPDASEGAVKEPPVAQTADAEVSGATEEKTDEKTDDIPAKKSPRRRRSRAKNPAAEETAVVADAVVEPPEEATDEAAEKPKRRRTRKKVKEPIAENENKPEPSETGSKEISEAARTTVINVGDEVKEVVEKPKKGWWRR